MHEDSWNSLNWKYYFTRTYFEWVYWHAALQYIQYFTISVNYVYFYCLNVLQNKLYFCVFFFTNKTSQIWLKYITTWKIIGTLKHHYCLIYSKYWLMIWIMSIKTLIYDYLLTLKMLSIILHQLNQFLRSRFRYELFFFFNFVI